MVNLVGMGPGDLGAMTRETYEALTKAEVIIGAKRLLESVPEGACGEKCPADVKDPISWYFNHLYYVHGVMPIGG